MTTKKHSSFKTKKIIYLHNKKKEIKNKWFKTRVVKQTLY